MKENALLASTSKTGGATIVAQYIAKLVKADPSIEVHMAGHSAGSIFHGGLVPLLVQQGVTIQTCTLWAPACTVDLFNSNYVPALKDNTIKRFAMFTLNDHAERDENREHLPQIAALSGFRRLRRAGKNPHHSRRLAHPRNGKVR